jgi:hypothetical protein
MLDGQQVSFGADSVHCSRSFSDAAIRAASDRAYRALRLSPLSENRPRCFDVTRLRNYQ